MSKHSKLKRYSQIFLVAIIAISALLLYKFYRFMWGTPYQNIGDKGSFGDAFNGLLAPFISLIGSILIYLSFQQQIRANRLQLKNNQIAVKQWRFDLHLKILEDIGNELSKIKTNSTVNGNREGPESLKDIAHVGWNAINGLDKALADLQGVLREFLFLIDRLEKEKDKYKHYLWQKIYLFYTVKLAAHLPFINNQIINEKRADSYQGIILLIGEIQSRIFKLQKQFESF